MNTCVIISCKKHGDFSRKPIRLIHDKLGCPICGIKKIAKHSTESFIKKANAVWGSLFNYTKVIYKGTHTKITIECKQHKRFFKQTPLNHLQGHNGCLKCLSLTKAKAATKQKLNRASSDRLVSLYYLKVISKNLFKIGVTKLTLQDRFGKKAKELEIIKTFTLPEKEAYQIESYILEAFEEYRTTYEGFGSGQTEFFNCDVLSLL